MREGVRNDGCCLSFIIACRAVFATLLLVFCASEAHDKRNEEITVTLVVVLENAGPE